MFGWLMVFSLSLHLVFNLFFIFRHIFMIIKLLFLKAYKYVNYLYDKKFAKKTEAIKSNEIQIN